MVVSCPHKCSVQTLLRSEVRHSQGLVRSPVMLDPVYCRLYPSELQASRVFMIVAMCVTGKAKLTGSLWKSEAKGKFRVENINN